MAVVALKSTPITNSDSTPPIKNNASIDGGLVRCAVGQRSCTLADDVGSTYRFCRIPSVARVKRVIFASGASGATGQLDIGIYQTAANGGAVVDADLFASALDPGGGAIAPTDVTHESGQYTHAESLTPLWTVLGLSADPHIDYDVVGTVTEIMADTGTSMKVEVEYVV